MHDNWNANLIEAEIRVNAYRANLADVTNDDVANRVKTACHGSPVGVLRTGYEQIPVLLRMRMKQRAEADDIGNLYVFAQTRRIPCR